MEWTESASLALQLADQVDVRETPRALLASALEKLEPSYWLHFRLRIDSEVLTQLIAPSQFFAHAPVEQIRRAAGLVASVLGAERVEIGAVALGWALTARSCSDEVLVSLNECMGMPAFDAEEAHNLREQILGKILLPEFATPSSNDEELDLPFRFPYGPASILERACRFLSIAVRITTALALCVGAVIGHGWWLILFGVGALVATQPSNRSAELLSSTTRPLVLPSRLPWALMCATALCLFGRPVEASLVAFCWFVVRGCAHVGEFLMAKGSLIDDDALPVALTTCVQAAQSFVVRNQIYDTAVTVGSGGLVVAVVYVGSPSASISALVGLGLWTACALENSAGRWGWTEFWFKVFAVLALALWATDVRWWVLVAPVAATCAMAVVRHNHRIHYRPLRSRGLDAVEREAWLNIAKGRFDTELTLLESVTHRSAELTSALALTHVLNGRPGEGRQLAQTLPPTHTSVRALIEAEADVLLGAPPGMTMPRHAAIDDLSRATELARLRALTSYTNPVDVATSICELIPKKITLETVPFAAECYLAISEALLTWSPSAAASLGSRGWGLADFIIAHDYEFLDREQKEARMFREPVVYRLAIRAAALLQMSLGEKEDNFAFDMANKDALQVLTELASPFVVAAYCNRGADLHRQRFGINSMVLDLRVQAFASLNDVRHTLTDSEDRALWWTAFTPTLDALLDESYARSDGALLLEVIEAARLQLGTSQEDLRPTAIRVGETSRIASSRYFFGRRPQTVAISDVLESAGGETAWWWATYVSNDYLYWSVAGSDGSVHGGRTKWALIRPILDEVDANLSFKRPGESEIELNRRLAASPLLGLPSPAEEALAEAVGSLIPWVIVRAIGDKTLRGTLCLALAPELARVPWPWVLIGQRRIVELFDSVIVPPASLITSLEGVDQSPSPVSVAVINPGGDLPGAEACRAHVPPSAKIVSSHQTDRLATLRSFLAVVPYDSSFVLACHTTEINGHRGFALGALDQVTEADVLFASDIARSDTQYPMPRQVIALACGTSEVASVRRGEWTILGAALIQAGARRALVTTFPVMDLPEVDRAVLEGVQDGVPLHILVATLQLSMLDRWREGDRAAAPMLWSGLQMFGTLPKKTETTRTQQQAWVHKDLLEGIDTAAELSPPGKNTVTVADLMTYFASYGHLDGLPLRQRIAVQRRFLLKPVLQQVRHREGVAQQRSLSPDLIEVLRDARDLANEAGHSVYDINHVFLAALRGSYPAAVLMRNLTGFDGRNPALVQRFTEDNDSGWHQTGETATPHLSAGESLRIYHLLVRRV